MTAEATRVMLLMSPATYRAAAFRDAADRLGIEVVSVVDMPEHLREHWRHSHGVAFHDLDAAIEEVVGLARQDRVTAVLAVDDSATELAAHVNQRLGFVHNSPESAVAARDKFVMRTALERGGVRCPRLTLAPVATPASNIDPAVEFPCVVKPLRLSGSRGVIRANDLVELDDALARVRRILSGDGVDTSDALVLIEEYLPGEEVAVEGLVTDGELHVLAIFDKPDPLVGPFFEETIYVTPSRLPAGAQDAIGREVADAARALGLVNGPVHAELRVNERGPWILEVAGRSIGGLCSTVLSFGAGMCLEELILRHAVGTDIPSYDRDGAAVGVMMIPIPKAGMLRAVAGQENALAVSGVTGLEITAKLNYPIVPLPEGASYLGFIFARGESPERVESALREAHAQLEIRIDAVVPMMQAAGQ